MTELYTLRTWHDVEPTRLGIKKRRRTEKNKTYAHMSLIRRLKERFHLSIHPLQQGDTRIGHGQ